MTGRVLHRTCGVFRRPGASVRLGGAVVMTLALAAGGRGAESSSAARTADQRDTVHLLERAGTGGFTAAGPRRPHMRPRSQAAQAPVTRAAGQYTEATGGSGFASSSFVPASLPPSPSPTAGFQAALDDGRRFTPDSSAAVGSNHLMAAFSSGLLIQDRSGTVLYTNTLEAFWSGLNTNITFVTDPRVIFDPYRNRWAHLAVANPGTNFNGLLLAVSQTGDPTGGWHRYYVRVDTGVGAGTFADSPYLGFNTNWLAVQANAFYLSNFSFARHTIYAFNKTNLYAGGAGTFTFFNLTDTNGGPQNAMCPALTYDPTEPNLYFLGNSDGINGDLRGYRLEGSVTSPDLIVTDEFEEPTGNVEWEEFSVGDTNFAPQLGSSTKIYCGDARIQSLVFRNTTLWAAHTVFLPLTTPSRAAVQYWEVTTGVGGVPVVIQTGRVEDGSNQKFYAFPSLAVNADNGMVMGYTRFGADQHPSANYSFRAEQDTFGLLRGDVVLKAGEAPFVVDNNGFNTWGLRSGAAVDAANDTELWLLQQYSSSIGGTNNDRWGTWWARVTPPVNLFVAMTDTPDPILAGQNVTYTITVSNRYPHNTMALVVSNTLSPSAEYVSSSASLGGCSHAGGVVTCTAPLVEEFDPLTVTITVRALNAGQLTNRVSVFSRGPEEFGGDNSTNVITTVNPAADLALSGMDSPDPVTVSNTLTYVLTVLNNGPSPAPSVGLTNLLSSAVSYVSAVPSQGSCTRVGSTVSCALGTIATQAQATVTITVTATNAGTFTNRAFVVTPATDLVSANNTNLLVTRANARPTIQSISNRTINEDSSTGPINFTVGDAETPAGSLTLLGLSSNTGLVPAPNIVFGGSGSARTVTVTPVPNGNGTATINCVVTDADGATSTNGFLLTVNAVNDPPTITAIADISIDEDTASAAIPFTIGDIETAASSLTVSAASLSPGIIPNGNITLGGSGANRTVMVRPATNATGTATITVTVNDGTTTTNESFDVTVNPVNDPPTITAIADRATNEDTPTGAIAFIVTDIETAAGSLTLSATSSDANIVPVAGVTFGGSGSNRTVNVLPGTNQFGTATVTVIVSDGGANATEPFVLTIHPVNDPPALDAINNVTVNEDSGQGTVPLAGIGPGATNEAQTLLVSATSSNPGLIPHPTVSYTSPNASGSLAFTPAANSNGTTTITVVVNDGGGSNNVFQRAFTITVNAVNDAPTISGLVNRSTDEDTATGPLPFTVGDIETAPGSLTLTGTSTDQTLVPNGNIAFGGSGANRTVNITPAANRFGACTIAVVVSDGGLTATNAFTLTVTPVNDPPTISAVADHSSLEDAVDVVNFTIGDIESALGTLVLGASSSNPSIVPNGNLVLGGSGANRTLTITPLPEMNGETTITITLTDPEGGMTNETFVLTVLNVNDPPTLNAPVNVVIDEDAPEQTVNLTGIGSGAANESQTLVVTALSSAPSVIPHPVVSYTSPNTTGSLRFTPVANSNGVVSITVTVNDGGSTNNLVSRVFTVTINPINDPPTISDVSDQTVNEDVAAGPLAFTIADIETAGGSLLLEASSSNEELITPAGITFGGSGANRTVTVLPLTNQFGSATITITVTDGSGAMAGDSFELVVNSVLDPPTISGLGNRTVNEDSGATMLAFSVDDPETFAFDLMLSASSSNQGLLPNANAVVGGAGASRTLTLTPLPDQFGVTTIAVVAEDSDGLRSTNSFVLTVAGVNDVPTLGALSDLNLVEDPGEQTVALAGIGTGAANELQTLVVSATSGAPAIVPHPTVTYTSPNATGTLRFTPATNATGAAVITVTVNDGGASNNLVTRMFTVNLSAVNDPPVILPIANQSVNEDPGTVNVAFVASDPESAPGSLILSAASSNPALVPTGNLVISGATTNRNLAVTPLADQSGSTTITLTNRDPQGLVFTRGFTFTVNPVNDPPTLDTPANVTINEDAPQQTVNLTGIGSGAPNEAQTLVVTAVSSVPGLIPNPAVTYTSPGATGTLRFTPTPNSNGVATVTVTVNDGGTSNNLATRMFTVTVNSVNDAPSISDITNRTADEDTAIGPLAFTVGDLETPAGSLTPTGASSNTGLVPNANITFGGSGANRTVTVTPATNQSGSATITITISDGSGGLASDTFMVTFNPVNDPPTVTDISNVTTNEDSQVNLAFTVGDVETAAANLFVTAASSNLVLVPGTGLVLGGSGASRTLAVTPAPNQNGALTIAVTVTDTNGASVTDTFTVTFNPVNDPPTLTGIPNQSIPEDTATGPLSFTIGDAETAAASLTVTATSSDTGLVPNGNVVLGGSGASRTVTVTPLPNARGSTTITVMVSDGTLSTNITFLVAVLLVSEPPIIVSQPQNQTVVGGSTAVFTVEAGGETPLNYQWRRNGSVLPGETNPTLTIPGAQPVHAGSYDVVVTNLSGARTSVVATLTVNVLSYPAVSVLLHTGSVWKYLDTGANLGTAWRAPTFDDSLWAAGPAQLGYGDGDEQTVVSFGPNSSAKYTNTYFRRHITVADPATFTNLVLRVQRDDGAVVYINSNEVFRTAMPAGAITSVTPASSTADTTNETFFFSTNLSPTVLTAGVNVVAVEVHQVNGTSSDISFDLELLGQGPGGGGGVFLSDTANQTMSEDAKLSLPLTVGSPRTAPSEVILTINSSNRTLLPLSNIVCSGSDSNRTLLLCPATHQTGTNLITVTAHDGASVSQDTFLLTVTAVNDAPTLNPLPDRTYAGNVAAQTINLTGISSGAGNESQALSVSASSSATSIVPNPTITYTSPNATGSISIDPSGTAGTAIIRVVVSDGSLSVTQSFNVVVRVTGNAQPTITTVANVTINEDAIAGPLAFTIGDSVTPATLLTLQGFSTNETLLPTNNIVFGGSGASRTVTLTPSPNQFGTSLVTITVTDTNFGMTNRFFTLTVNPVNDLPELSALPDQMTTAGTPTAPVPFTVSDVETPAPNLIVTAASGNPALVPPLNVAFIGNGTNRALVVTPAAGEMGTATITITVSDGTGGSTNRSFVLTVTPAVVSSGPFISSVGGQAIDEDAALGPLAFTVGDAVTPAGLLALGAASSNPALVPTNNIAFGGSASNRTITVTPVAQQFGTSVVSIIVVGTNGSSSTEAFLLTVRSVNDAPALAALSNLNLGPNAPLQTVNLSGINAGPANESGQTLFVAASSSNPGLIPHPAVNYASPGTTGTLTFTPVPNSNGTATITVSVNDGQPQNNITTRTFSVTVNAAPTITAVPAQSVNEDTGSAPAPFVIGDAETAAGSLTVTASSSNTGLVQNAAITLGGSGASRTVAFSPVGNQFGSTLITLRVQDANGNAASNTFLAAVNAVNDGPSLSPLGNMTVFQGDPLQMVNLAGIGFGPANEAQSLTVSASTSDPALTAGLGVSYTSPNSTGTLTFTPSASTNGTATVTVTVRDSGGTASGGVDTMIRAFTVTVDLPVPPTLTIELSGGKALVSWPGNSSPQWALQFNTNLSNPMGWVPEGTAPSLVGGRFTVTNTPTGLGRFYRLAR